MVAAGVSFADLLQTRGAYRMRVPVPYTPGMDAAGVVRSAGPGSGLVLGQRVAVLLSHGCWQEVLSAPAERVLPLPDGMSFEAGAAAPLNYLTGLFGWSSGHGRSRVRRCSATGRREVRTAAIQLGRASACARWRSSVTRRSSELALRCGADHAGLSDGWLAVVRDQLGERAVDIVVNPVGSDRITEACDRWLKRAG